MLLTKLWYRCLTYNRNPGLHSKLALNHEIPTSENHCLKHTTMRRRWTEERRQNRIEADWIVAWLRDNGPATIREIVQALERQGRDVKPTLSSAHSRNLSSSKKPEKLKSTEKFIPNTNSLAR